MLREKKSTAPPSVDADWGVHMETIKFYYAARRRRTTRTNI